MNIQRAYERAYQLERAGEYDNAVAAYRALIEEAPAFAAIYLRIAACYDAMQRPDASAAILERARQQSFYRDERIFDPDGGMRLEPGVGVRLDSLIEQYWKKAQEQSRLRGDTALLRATRKATQPVASTPEVPEVIDSGDFALQAENEPENQEEKSDTEEDQEKEKPKKIVLKREEKKKEEVNFFRDLLGEEFAGPDNASAGGSGDVEEDGFDFSDSDEDIQDMDLDADDWAVSVESASVQPVASQQASISESPAEKPVQPPKAPEKPEREEESPKTSAAAAPAREPSRKSQAPASTAEKRTSSKPKPTVRVVESDILGTGTDNAGEDFFEEASSEPDRSSQGGFEEVPEEKPTKAKVGRSASSSTGQQPMVQEETAVPEGNQGSDASGSTLNVQVSSASGAREQSEPTLPVGQPQLEVPGFVRNTMENGQKGLGSILDGQESVSDEDIMQSLDLPPLLSLKTLLPADAMQGQPRFDSAMVAMQSEYAAAMGPLQPGYESPPGLLQPSYDPAMNAPQPGFDMGMNLMPGMDNPMNNPMNSPMQPGFEAAMSPPVQPYDMGFQPGQLGMNPEEYLPNLVPPDMNLAPAYEFSQEVPYAYGAIPENSPVASAYVPAPPYMSDGNGQGQGMTGLGLDITTAFAEVRFASQPPQPQIQMQPQIMPQFMQQAPGPNLNMDTMMMPPIMEGQIQGGIPMGMQDPQGYPHQPMGGMENESRSAGQPETDPQYERKVMLALLLFFPLGLWMLWRPKLQWSKRLKIIVTILVVVVAMLVTATVVFWQSASTAQQAYELLFRRQSNPIASDQQNIDLPDRDSPAQIGTAYEVNVPKGVHTTEHRAVISLLEVIRGKDALDNILRNDPEAAAPVDGQEYILARFSYQIIDAGEQKVTIGHDLFELADESGTITSRAPEIFGLYPEFSKDDLVTHDTYEGWTYFQGAQGEKAFAVFRSGTSAEIWFDLSDDMADEVDPLPTIDPNAVVDGTGEEGSGDVVIPDGETPTEGQDGDPEEGSGD